MGFLNISVMQAGIKTSINGVAALVKSLGINERGKTCPSFFGELVCPALCTRQLYMVL